MNSTFIVVNEWVQPMAGLSFPLNQLFVLKVVSQSIYQTIKSNKEIDCSLATKRTIIGSDVERRSYPTTSLTWIPMLEQQN